MRREDVMFEVIMKELSDGAHDLAVLNASIDHLDDIDDSASPLLECSRLVTEGYIRGIKFVINVLEGEKAESALPPRIVMSELEAGLEEAGIHIED